MSVSEKCYEFNLQTKTHSSKRCARRKIAIIRVPKSAHYFHLHWADSEPIAVFFWWSPSRPAGTARAALLIPKVSVEMGFSPRVHRAPFHEQRDRSQGEDRNRIKITPKIPLKTNDVAESSAATALFQKAGEGWKDCL